MREDLMAGVPKVKGTKRERVRVSAAMLLELLDDPDDPRDRGFLAFLENTGVRASEITKIRIEHVDLDLGEVAMVRPQAGDIDWMPFTNRLDAELRRWMTHYAQELGNAP